MKILNRKEINNLSRINWLRSTSICMQCYSMCKIEFHGKEFRKRKISNGIEFFKFCIKKVLKKYEKWWEPIKSFMMLQTKNPMKSLHIAPSCLRTRGILEHLKIKSLLYPTFPEISRFDVKLQDTNSVR